MIDKGFSLYALVLWLLLIKVAVSDDDDHVYSLGFTDVAEDCQDFTNDVVKANLGLTPKEDHAALSGTIDIEEELGDGCELFLDIVKKLDNGREDPVFSVATDLCTSIKDKDAPWSDVYKTMNITECPIAPKSYTLQDLMISLDFAKDFLSHEFVNKYNVKLSVKCGALEEITCITVGIEIIED